jgi:riboflavin kinase/FMN adenylyltransferase
VKLVRGLSERDASVLGGAVSIGNFDGVHRGHARIIERLRALAQRVAGPAVVFTFEPHPIQLLRPDAVPPPLTRLDDKLELLEKLQVDVAVVYPTDRELLQLSPRAFFQQILLEGLAARALAEGPNFYFGKDRAGDIPLLESFCRAQGIVLEVVPLLLIEKEYVSSSRIRNLLRLGQVAEANRLLTQPYQLRGAVVHGAGRGAKLGFATANLEAIETILPASGVYAARAITTTGSWPAAVNIGANPTFGEQQTKVEAHLLDFSGNLYGQSVKLELLQRLRGTVPFPSVDALREQLVRDLIAVRETVARFPAS